MSFVAFVVRDQRSNLCGLFVRDPGDVCVHMSALTFVSCPVGLACSFEVDSLTGLDIEWLAPPTRLQQQPYLGRLAACCLGAGGELLELIERQ